MERPSESGNLGNHGPVREIPVFDHFLKRKWLPGVQNGRSGDSEYVCPFDIRDRTVRGTLEVVRCSFLFLGCSPSLHDNTANINSRSFEVSDIFGSEIPVRNVL